MKDKILVTSYCNPDLDGTACMVAYSELLKKQGKNAVCGYFGNLHEETIYVLREFNIPKPPKGDKLIEECGKIILVDASNPIVLDSKIDPKKVVEIIDHRKKHRVENFPNAKGQIELVGAAATLITEKYIESKVPIDRESAILLYGAIVSNTLNFKSNTMTERDGKAADWLRQFIDIPDSFARDMFLAKSNFGGKNIKEILIQDRKTVGKDAKVRFSIFQLEVVDLEKIIENNKKEILDFLKEEKDRQQLDYTFLTGIDLEKGFNIFAAVDEETKDLLEKSLEIKFIDNIAKREGLLMRKEIIPIIEEHM
ncbi:MAG: DHH family phosphoesterase [Candidatus Aenigmarchaeota archaeon]|nr:DHH family phosphoesterase [Candidatus Aenigmarchaeota archaeon]